MATVHRTTLSPTKLELLGAWLPAQPWYAGPGPLADPVKAGGFRLDDPAGEVGIEFMAVADRAAGEPVTYHVPLTYRGAPLDGAQDALLGTSEHGVLGRRWVYDGAHDPVLVTQLLGLALGSALPQAQSVSDTPAPEVRGSFTGRRPAAGTGPVRVLSGPEGTEVLLRAPGDAPEAGLLLRVRRVLRAGDEPAAVGEVVAPWQTADGAERVGRYAEFHRAG